MLYQIIKSLYAITSKARDSIELNALRFEFRHDAVDIVATDGRCGVALTLLTETPHLAGQSFNIAGGEIENKLLPALKFDPDAEYVFLSSEADSLVLCKGLDFMSLLAAGQSKLNNWRAAFGLDALEPTAESLTFNPAHLLAVLGVFKPFTIKSGVVELIPRGTKQGTIVSVPLRCINETYAPYVTAIQAVVMPCGL